MVGSCEKCVWNPCRIYKWGTWASIRMQQCQALYYPIQLYAYIVLCSLDITSMSFILRTRISVLREYNLILFLLFQTQWRHIIAPYTVLFFSTSLLSWKLTTSPSFVTISSIALSTPSSDFRSYSGNALIMSSRTLRAVLPSRDLRPVSTR